MTSIAARAVAEEVLESIGKGQKPSVRQIARRQGYAPSTADSGEIQQTKTYQSVVQPFVSAMEQQRQRAIEAIAARKLSKDRTRDLVDMIDKLTKNIQLLTGGSTENVAKVVTIVKYAET